MSKREKAECVWGSNTGRENKRCRDVKSQVCQRLCGHGRSPRERRGARMLFLSKRNGC